MIPPRILRIEEWSPTIKQWIGEIHEPIDEETYQKVLAVITEHQRKREQCEHRGKVTYHGVPAKFTGFCLHPDGPKAAGVGPHEWACEVARRGGKCPLDRGCPGDRQ